MKSFVSTALCTALLLSSVFAPVTRAASTVEIAPSHQAKIILAGLSFFKKLPADAGGNLNILIVGTCPVSDALKELEGKAINGLKIKFEQADKTTEADLRKQLESKPFAALYDCSRQAESAKQISEIALAAKVIHMAPSSQAVENGALLATEVHQGRPGLVLNMGTVKNLGATFDARLAGVARFIQ